MSAEEYDAIVIGSGAGGAAAAYRLVLGGLRVALVEKGGPLPTDGSTLDIRRVVHEGEFLSREAWVDGRGRRLTPEEHFNVGGKTKWYGAALLRFASHEFLPDAAHGCGGWPLAASDLAPYYAEAEQLLGVRSFACEPDLARILARMQRRGSPWQAQAMPLALAADLSAHPVEATHFDGFASVRNLKGEAEQSLLARLRARENFTLLVNAEVTALLGSAHSAGTVSGVQLADGRELRASRVMLAAGALHSPRLLARYLKASGLEAHLPAAAHVGRNLKLHLLTAMVSLSRTLKSDLIRKTMLLTHERFVHSSVQPLGFDGELIATLFPKVLPAALRRELGTRAYGFFLQTEDGSDTRNRVIESCDAQASPVLDYDESRLPAAAREHRRFRAALQFALARAGLASFTMRIGLKGTAHACGSLICGHNASDSVVDALGLVHGMKGLYVVDGSVLARSSRVNPSLTIYAWALRVGDIVARQFQREREPAQVSTHEVSHAL
jgi:choline dehydrogenase-like flavoprotein